MTKSKIEIASAIELLKNPEAILQTLPDSHRDDTEVQEAKEYLQTLSNDELGNLLPEIAYALGKNNENIQTIYDDIKKKKSDPKKSIDPETIQTGIEIVKNSVGIIAAIISILEKLGYLDFLKKKQKNANERGEKRQKNT